MGRSHPARKALSDSLVALTKERNALLDAHGNDDDAVTKWQDAHNNFENCMGEAIPKLTEGHRAELQQRVMSREVQQQQATLAPQLMAAVQANDTVAAHKVQARMMALMNPWAARDSAAAFHSASLTVPLPSESSALTTAADRAAVACGLPTPTRTCPSPPRR